jgi:hypothetical protein
VICCKHYEHILQTDEPVEIVEQLRQQAVGPDGNVAHFRLVGPKRMTHNIIGRKTDGQEIGDCCQ